MENAVLPGAPLPPPPAADSDEPLLLARAAAGDEAAYEALFLRQGDRLWKSAYLLLQSSISADDVLRELYAWGWRELSLTRPPPGSARSWLVGGALEICRRLLRDQFDAPDLGNLETLERWRRMAHPRIIRGVVSLVVRRDPDPRLALALSYLSWDQREAVVLRYVAELRFEELAPLLGMTPGAVRTLTQRARALLRQKLGGGPS